MPTRPTQGGSAGTWGTELEANLAVSIDKTTGALVPAQVAAALPSAVDGTGVLLPAAVRTALGGYQTLVASIDPVRAWTRFVAQSNPTVNGIRVYVTHRGPTGTLWAREDSGLHIFKSTDNGTTWTNTNPTGVISGITAVYRILELASGVVLAAGTGSGGPAVAAMKVSRSTDGGATFTAATTQPFTQAAAAGEFTSMLGSGSWFQMPASSPVAAGTIFAAEYGDNAALAAMHLFTSTDDGDHWTNAYTWDPASPADGSGTIRHLHSVQLDKYVAGRIWVCIGDNGYARVGYSDNGGTSWTWITSSVAYVADGLPGGGDNQSRATMLMFTSSAVFWCADQPLHGNVYKYDRTTHLVSQVGVSGVQNYYWPNSFQQMAMTWDPGDGGDPILIAGGSIESFQTDTDDLMRIVGSADGGLTWNETEFKWRRKAGTLAGFWDWAEPDSNGICWITATNVNVTSEAAIPAIPVKCRLRRAWLHDRDSRTVEARFHVGQRATPVTGANYGTFSVLTDMLIMQADADMWIDSATVLVSADSTHTSDATNFWTISLVAYDPVSGIVEGTIAAFGGASHAQAPKKAWNLLSSTGLGKIPSGYAIALRVNPGGTPAANLVNPRVAFVARKANFDLP